MASVVERLYPPTISGSIPAFYNNNGAVSITVPFSMNRAVSASSVGGFALKIKTAQSNVWLTTLEIRCADDTDDISSYIANRQITFQWGNDSAREKIKLGQYLKFQLAYIAKQSGVTGYFSTVAIGKYTSKPTIYLQNAAGTGGRIPNFLQTYTGIYQPGEDKSERPYQYCFLLYDTNMSLIENSGWKIHNSIEDETINQTLTLDSASDTYIYETSLEENKVYYVQYGVRTINNLEIFTPAYPCAEINGGDDSLSLSMNIVNNFDEGYIQISFNDIQETNEQNNSAVSLQIERSEITDGFQGWRILKKVYFASYNDVKVWFFRDFTVEQGVAYKYRYKIYNSNNVVARQSTTQNAVVADFEDMFLLGADGLQVKIRFNPKVSSFKDTILEQKTDTIGSRFPFIFRNGVVSYKQFPIAGLISYRADNNEMFLNHLDDLNIILEQYTERQQSPVGDTDDSYKSAETLDSVGYNMLAERRFKLKLLNWLNDGKIKLFRSPAEGNYLVRIMNVSLSPEDKVGRMLHNFSCQAYEIEELTYNNLLNLGFINIDEKEEITKTTVTIPLSTKVSNDEAVQLNDYPIYESAHIYLSGNTQSSGQIYVRIGTSENNKVLINTNNNNGLELYYPNSQIPDIYFYPSDNAELKGNNQTYQDFVQGIEFQYDYLVSTILSGDIYFHDYVVDDVYLQNIVRSYYSNQNDETTVTIAQSYDVGNPPTEYHERLKILTMYFHRKTIVQVVFRNNAYYLKGNSGVQVSNFSKKNIYEVFANDEDTTNIGYKIPTGNNNILQDATNILYNVKFYNGNELIADFEENPLLSLTTVDFNKLKIGNGIYVDCVIQEKVTKYHTNS